MEFRNYICWSCIKKLAILQLTCLSSWRWGQLLCHFFKPQEEYCDPDSLSISYQAGSSDFPPLFIFKEKNNVGKSIISKRLPSVGKTFLWWWKTYHSQLGSSLPLNGIIFNIIVNKLIYSFSIAIMVPSLKMFIFSVYCAKVKLMANVFQWLWIFIIYFIWLYSCSLLPHQPWY